MKSSNTAELLKEDPPAPVAAVYNIPNSEGVFEDYEKVFVHMPAGNICAFYLAHTADGIYIGWDFWMRQPRNHVTALPKLESEEYLSRHAAIDELVHLAEEWFSDHANLLERIREFHAKLKAGKTTAEIPPAAEPVQIVEMPVVASEAATIPPRPHYAEIPVSEIAANPDNPRRSRAQADIDELAASIKANGQLQAIAVRDMGVGREGKPDAKRYQIIFGEGRWLAHQQLGLPTIEAKVYIGVDGATVLAFALIENLQRRDMNALDEAEGFAELSRLGWTPARMAEQTGKDKRSIRRSLAMMKLPEAVRELVRSGELSARQANALVRWVVPPGFEHDEAAAGFVARPAVCTVIANVAAKSACDISSDVLANEVPAQAIGALLQEKLIAEIPSVYRDSRTDDLAGFETAGRLYALDIEAWKARKKEIDDDAKAAAKRSEEKALAKVENKVSVPVAELTKGKVNVAELTGADEIYADYLPEGACATGIGAGGAEVMVCLKPDLLKQLKDAEAHELRKDLEQKSAEALESAKIKLRKLKRIGSREVALLIVATQVTFNGGIEDLEIWQAAGLKMPRDADKLTQLQLLEGLQPAEQFRLFMAAQLADEGFGDNRLELLRWILERKDLGLIRDSAKLREALLEKLSAQLWPKSDTPVQGITRFKWNENGVCTNAEVMRLRVKAPGYCEIRMAQLDTGEFVTGWDYGMNGSGVGCGGCSSSPQLRDPKCTTKETAAMSVLLRAERWFSGSKVKGAAVALKNVQDYMATLKIPPQGGKQMAEIARASGLSLPSVSLRLKQLAQEKKGGRK